MLVGFGIALLLDPADEAQGPRSPLPPPADDDVGGGRRPVLAAATIRGRTARLRPRPSRPRLAVPTPTSRFYAIAITDVWMWAPFVMLLSLAGLSAVPQHLYEAAAIDRAGSWYTFSRITLPLVTPLLLHRADLPHDGGVQDLRHRLRHVDQPTTELISIKLYSVAFRDGRPGKSCAMAYIVLIMVLSHHQHLRQVPEPGQGR